MNHTIAALLRLEARRFYGAGPWGTTSGLLLCEQHIGEALYPHFDNVMPGPVWVNDADKDGHIHRSFALLLAAEVIEQGDAP